MPRIIPIKDLKNTSEISELCKSSGEPIFVTKNGYGDMVIMSMETYETLVDTVIDGMNSRKTADREGAPTNDLPHSGQGGGDPYADPYAGPNFGGMPGAGAPAGMQGDPGSPTLGGMPFIGGMGGFDSFGGLDLLAEEQARTGEAQEAEVPLPHTRRPLSNLLLGSELSGLEALSKAMEVELQDGAATELNEFDTLRMMTEEEDPE